MPTFTLSRDDVYNYLRCPKIVAIKSYRILHPPQKTKVSIRAEPEVPASIVGKIGEAAVAVVLSPVAIAAGLAKLKETVAQRTESVVSKMGVILDANSKKILNETVEGLTDIRNFITEEYGDVQVIGRGGCKNGLFPGEALPDFVALSPKHKQPILIEVKNTPKPLKSDHFQASFYNTVARKTGVVVHEQRFESGQLNLVPVAYHESIVDTLLVYPRASAYERIVDQVDMKERTIKEIWRAKQLGFVGKSPHTDCDSKCPHYRLGVELPEGNLEAAPPLPLVYAQGLTEADADLDTDYLHNYFFKSGLASGMFDWILRAERDSQRKSEIVVQIATRTGIPRDVVERMVFTRSKTPDSEKVFQNMAGEIEPWEKILGKERMKDFGTKTAVQGLATRLYTLPNKSGQFVKRSWKKWQK